MKKNFYPYSGPAGKDNPSHPYPSWYYPRADSTAFIAHNVQEYITAVDFFYRVIFGESAGEIWFIGLDSGRPSLLPPIFNISNSSDGTSEIANFSSHLKTDSALTYPELLIQMALQNIPTRLLEWTGNAIEALLNALEDSGDGPATVFALNPLGLNSHISRAGNDVTGVPDASNPNIIPLFGNMDGDSGSSMPFSVVTESFGSRRLFTVFPNNPEAKPLERLPDSSDYLFRIQVPSMLRNLVMQQLKRLGVL